jgi:hypothetical protein
MAKHDSDRRELIRMPSKRLGQMLDAYRANMARGCAEVREMILGDIRRFRDLGAQAYVDDLTEVLFMFDEEAIVRAYPQWRSMRISSIGH